MHSWFRRRDTHSASFHCNKNLQSVYPFYSLYPPLDFKRAEIFISIRLQALGATMFREGIIGKLGMALGAFTLLSLVSTLTLYSLLERFNQGLSSILEEARPLDVAANEMEIQGLEYGIAVKSFLRFPDSAHLDMTVNAIDEFKKFHGMYTKLAGTDAQRAIAQEVDAVFSKYTKTGDNLLELQTVYLAQHNGFITGLNELGEATIKAAALDDAKISGSFQ
ncbi:MAG TPA: hypothetical protein VFW37_12980, partial [Alphaproteobacteria bacterium]|nr:hypothetical protein [Alphaproteobacteria bacterium]